MAPDEEKQLARRFQVHHFYVVAIAEFICDQYGHRSADCLRALLEWQQSQRSYRKISRNPGVNEAKVRQFLTLAWASELQHRLAGLSETSLLQYTNAWSPIHSYYAVYMSSQAWFTSMGTADLVENHSATLNTLSNQIEQRNLFPPPWSTLCAGCSLTGDDTYKAVPADVDPKGTVEVLSRPSPETFWQRYCKMLRTTRDGRLEHNIDEWKRQNDRKRTYKHEKRTIAGKLPATSIFDFLWRLRVRSNYKDVRTYLMSDVDEEWQREFWESLTIVTESTCFVLQSLVSAYAGRDIYRAVIDDFIRAQGTDIAKIKRPFEQRRELLG